MMASTKTIFFVLLSGCIALRTTGLPIEEGSPTIADGADKSTDYSFVGRASNVVAKAMLQNNIDSTGNFVFSPIGFSSILAILGEGAREQTRTEISQALSLPEDIEKVRSGFKSVLARLQGEDPRIAPQFKTWFYIYRNNTAETDFRNNIHEWYWVDVKDIDRNDYDWNEPKTSIAVDNSKDIQNFEDLKKSGTILESDSESEPIIEKESSKFDKHVDDKQYVEVPVIREQIKKEQEANAEQKPEDSFADDVEQSLAVDLDQASAELTEVKDKIESPIKIEKENIAETPIKEEPKVEEKPAKETATETSVDLVENKPEEINSDLVEEKLESIVVDLVEEKPDIVTSDLIKENHPIARKFHTSRMFRSFDDIVSALSGTSLVGRKHKQSDTVDETDGEETESKMLLFNGLYFRGSWATPFQQLRNEPEDVFYMGGTNREPITMMRSRGLYRVAKIAELDAEAIELPYENKRYSMLIVLPNERDGLKRAIADFTEDSVEKMMSALAEEPVDLSFPKFRTEATCRAEKAFAKNGITTLFNRKADMSGLTKDQQLFVDELVQHVVFRVDEVGSTENSLTATNAVRSEAIRDKIFKVDHPFLFFVRDVVDNLTIIAGKISEPSTKDNYKF